MGVCHDPMVREREQGSGGTGDALYALVQGGMPVIRRQAQNFFPLTFQEISTISNSL